MVASIANWVEPVQLVSDPDEKSSVKIAPGAESTVMGLEVGLIGPTFPEGSIASTR